MQWTQDFYMKNPYTNYGDKKTARLKAANLNPLYEIKLHIFTWPIYLKDLLSSTYNLIHICDVTTSNCFSEYALASLKGCRSSTLNS